MPNKRELGQFYTTNYEYILQGISVPNETQLIEPFCGEGDLVKWVGKPFDEIYDIDPKIIGCVNRDTLMNPPSYSGKWVITNPPYLAKNKADNKRPMNLYKVDDLYKCFMETLILDPPDGGVIIIPLNYWCSIRNTGSNKFCKEFWVSRMNIFEEQVFDDTSYTVCAFKFTKGATNGRPTEIKMFPGSANITQVLDACPFGKEIYKLPQNPNISINRLTPSNANVSGRTHIHMKCFDDIHLWWDDTVDYMDRTPKLTQRMYGTLVINPPPKDQKKLVEIFNTFLQAKRKEHNSLFLTNYRERDRKRISFSLLYTILNWCHSAN